MVIDRPLRSGQQVYARDADLIVLGLVSHGAEVIADGHIHVYGALRRQGRANGQGGLVPQLELHASPVVLCRREKDQRPRDLRKGDAPLLA